MGDVGHQSFFKKKRIVDDALLEQIRKMSCVCCGERPVDPCHVKTRGSGGDDIQSNVFPACRRHHDEQGKAGFYKMTKKYPNLGMWLWNHGWTFEGRKLVRRLSHEEESVCPAETISFSKVASPELLESSEPSE